MNEFNFGFEMQKQIIRLQGLPEDNALSLLVNYLILEEERNELQKQLIYAIENNGEYLQIDKILM